MPKKDGIELVKTVKVIAPSVLFEELRCDIEEHFKDATLKAFTARLL